MRAALNKNSVFPKKEIPPENNISSNTPGENNSGPTEIAPTHIPDAEITRAGKQGNIKTSGHKVARPRTREDRKSLVEKIAANLADVLTEEDLERVAKVYRDALGAKQRFWIDEGKDEFGKSIGHWEWQDDHKTRIQAANMIAAYKEGLPVQRQVVLTKAFESAEETIKKIKDSPELIKAIQALQGSGLALEAGGEIIDIESEELR